MQTRSVKRKRGNQRAFLRNLIEEAGEAGTTGPELLERFEAEFGKPLFGHSARLSEMRDQLYEEGLGLYSHPVNEMGENLHFASSK